MAITDVQQQWDLTPREAQTIINELVWLFRHGEPALARALLAEAARRLGWRPEELLGRLP